MKIVAEVELCRRGHPVLVHGLVAGGGEGREGSPASCSTTHLDRAGRATRAWRAGAVSPDDAGAWGGRLRSLRYSVALITTTLKNNENKP